MTPAVRVAAGLRRQGSGLSGWWERLVSSLSDTPARIMGPRLGFICAAAALTVFGLVMIFSASSAEAVSETGNAWYYFGRQAAFIGVGVIVAIGIAAIDYRVWRGLPLAVVIGAVIVALVAVRIFGEETNGATRWLQLGFFSLQPSELAKAPLLVALSYYAVTLLQPKETPTWQNWAGLFCSLIVPLGLIFFQPDKGTTGIIAISVALVVVRAGMPKKVFAAIAVAFCAFFAFYMVADNYSLARILTAYSNPWTDAGGDGYQLTRGFLAFATGGFFGKGLGMSRMKYSYLPEAHNDFIFAVIGEELGTLGILVLLALFYLLVREGLKIGRNAPDEQGRLLVEGCLALIITQMAVNVLGVLGLTPLTGKPLPFISYGGSSIIGTLMLVGCVLSVSVRSRLPETEHDRRRQQMQLADEDTGVGEPHVRGGRPARPARPYAGAPRSREAYEPARPRPARGQATPLTSAASARRGLRVVEGGAARERIDLGPSASERLRPSQEGPQVRTDGSRERGQRGREPRRRR